MRGGDGWSRTARKLAKARMQLIAQCVTETGTVQRSPGYQASRGGGELPWRRPLPALS